MMMLWLYENHICELQSEELNDICATFAVAKRKPEKNSGLYAIGTLDLCDTGAAL